MNKEQIRSVSVPPEIIAAGIVTTIPHIFLHGIQLPHEFRGERLRRIGKKIKAEGVSYLERNPVITTVVSSHVFILDGHHRARVAPNYEIYSIPTIIVELQEVAKLFPLQIPHLIEQLYNWAFEAVDAFQKQYEQRRKPYRAPARIPEGRTLENLLCNNPKPM